MKSVLLLFQLIYQKLWSVGPLQQKIKLPSPNTKLQKQKQKTKTKNKNYQWYSSIKPQQILNLEAISRKQLNFKKPCTFFNKCEKMKIKQCHTIFESVVIFPEAEKQNHKGLKQ